MLSELLICLIFCAVQYCYCWNYANFPTVGSKKAFFFFFITPNLFWELAFEIFKQTDAWENLSFMTWQCWNPAGGNHLMWSQKQRSISTWLARKSENYCKSPEILRFHSVNQTVPALVPLDFTFSFMAASIITWGPGWVGPPLHGCSETHRHERTLHANAFFLLFFFFQRLPQSVRRLPALL